MLYSPFLTYQLVILFSTMNKSFLSLFLLILLIIGCQMGTGDQVTNESLIEPDFSSVAEISYTGREVVPENLCTSSTRLFKDGGYLILLNDRDDSLLSFFDLTKGKMVRYFGRKGSEKGNFIGLQSLTGYYSRQSDYIAALDITLNKILEINLDSIIHFVAYRPVKEFYFPKNNLGPIDIVNGPDNTFVSLMFNDDKRFVFYRLNDSLFVEKGDLPLGKDEKTLHKTLKGQAYQGIIGSSPDQTHLVVAYKLTDLLQIFNEKGELLHTIKGPDRFKPEYTVGQMGAFPFLKFSAGTKQGYADVRCTKKYIYALYVGKQIESKEYTGSSTQIFVFDYSGQLQKKIILPQPVLSFVCDDSGPETQILALADPSRKKVMMFTQN
jgi:hypothetical protein